MHWNCVFTTIAYLTVNVMGLSPDQSSQSQPTSNPVIKSCPRSQVCYTIQDLGNEFEFGFEYNHKEVGWVSIGSGYRMKGSAMIVAWRNPDNSVIVSDRASTGHSQPAPKQTISVLSKSSTQLGDQLTKIIIRRPKTVGVEAQANIDPTQNDWIWAFSKSPPKGTDQNARLSYHENNFGKFWIDFPKGTSQSNGQYYFDTPFLIHAILMFLGWNAFPFVGIIVAGPFRDVLGVWWFRIHVALMALVAPAFVLGGFALAYMQKSSSHFTNPHEKLGLAVMAMTLAQIISGVVIDRLYDPNRTKIPWYDKLHWWFGRILYVLAQAAIVLGLLMWNDPINIVGIWIGYSVILVAEVGILGYYKKVKKAARVEVIDDFSAKL